MSLTRREFLRGMGGILAAGVAPAFIGADVLMSVKKIWTPPRPFLDVPRIVDTIDELRRLNPPIGEGVLVRGFYRPGDGGGGVYGFNPHIQMAMDDGLIFGPGLAP